MNSTRTVTVIDSKASCSSAGSCWVREWNEQSPQIKSVEARSMTGLLGKLSRRMPSARPEERAIGQTLEVGIQNIDML